MFILRDEITLLFQKWRYRCCPLHYKNKIFFFRILAGVLQCQYKAFSLWQERDTVLYPPWFLDTNKHTNTVLVQLLFSVPLACVVDHDIARNETWRLISLGHLRVGRPCTACRTLLSYSLHHCGTSVIYIYFIKYKKNDNIEKCGTIEACMRLENGTARNMHLGRVCPHCLAWHCYWFICDGA